MKCDAQGVPESIQFDAKTNQKLILKQITEKIRKITKNHVSPKNKIIEIQWKTNVFDGLEGCMCE